MGKETLRKKDTEQNGQCVPDSRFRKRQCAELDHYVSFSSEAGSSYPRTLSYYGYNQRARLAVDMWITRPSGPSSYSCTCS